MTDAFTVRILEDGSVVAETDGVSPANHMSADEFLKFLAKELGGEVTKTKRPVTHNKVQHKLHQGG